MRLCSHSSNPGFLVLLPPPASADDQGTFAIDTGRRKIDAGTGRYSLLVMDSQDVLGLPCTGVSTYSNLLPLRAGGKLVLDNVPPL